jgi:hypothetical protein
MSRHKTNPSLWLFLFSLTLYLSLTGCATLAVDQLFLRPQSDFIDEFTPKTNELAGTYFGLETINGHSYASIIVLPVSNDCKEKPVIELLLPMEKNSDAKSTLRLGKSTNEQLPGGDKYAGQPVRIVFYSSSHDDDEMSIDQTMTFMLSGHNWRGYPSVVIVGYKKNIRYIDRLAYRIAPEVNDVLVRPFDCNELCDTPWKCKNRGNKVAGIILIPFAVVFDTITAPAQLLLTLVNLPFPGRR